jgi:hypothetical protein
METLFLFLLFVSSSIFPLNLCTLFGWAKSRSCCSISSALGTKFGFSRVRFSACARSNPVSISCRTSVRARCVLGAGARSRAPASFSFFPRVLLSASHRCRQGLLFSFGEPKQPAVGIRFYWSVEIFVACQIWFPAQDSPLFATCEVSFSKQTWLVAAGDFTVASADPARWCHPFWILRIMFWLVWVLGPSGAQAFSFFLSPDSIFVALDCRPQCPRI